MKTEQGDDTVKTEQGDFPQPPQSKQKMVLMRGVFLGVEWWKLGPLAACFVIVRYSNRKDGKKQMVKN